MKIGVLLSGCGIGDGSQIEEVILTYLALDKYGVDYLSFAPEKFQHHTINHYIEKIDIKDERNILVESARIGRGKIKALSKLSIDEIDGLIIPGGCGVFKNLSNYITEKENFIVEKDIEFLIKSMYESKKPIGAMCGAIILIGYCLHSEASELRLSTYNSMFCKLFEKNNILFQDIEPTDAYIDVQNKVVTTPAFIGTQNLYEMNKGIDKLVKEVINLTS